MGCNHGDEECQGVLPVPVFPHDVPTANLEEGWPVGEAGGVAAEDCPCGCGGACGCAETIEMAPPVLPAEAEEEATDDCGCGGACECAEGDEAVEYEEDLESYEDVAPVEADEAMATDAGESAAPAAGLPAAAWQELRAQLLEDLARLWGKPSRECGAVVGSGGRFQEDFYGDGSDGDLEVEGDWGALGRDMYYNNVVIRDGGRMRTYGFRVYVKGKLTIESTGRLDCDGPDATTWQGASPPAAPGRDYYSYPNRWQMPASGVGGDSGAPSGAGTAIGAPAAGGRGQARVRGFGPARLLGGCGGGGGGGTGDSPPDATEGVSVLGPNGGDGGSATNDGSSVQLNGGGGGAGAGVVEVYAHEIDNAGSISADGGAGASGQVSGACQAGAGGGGGGGAVILYYTTASGSGVGTVTADGGPAGSTGGAGTDGEDGVVLTYAVNV